MNSSGVEDAWIAAGWYDSSCLIREVFECGNMKRSLEAHEATLLAINQLLIKSVLDKRKNDTHKQLLPHIISLRTEIVKPSGYEKMFKIFWNQLKDDLNFLNLNREVQQYAEQKNEDKMFSFLMVYSNMVRRLFLFIEASRIRNWEQHLDAAEDLIPDLAAMNRVKYRRMLPVYVTEMRHLRENDEIS